MSFKLVQLISLAIEEQEGQDVFSCTCIGVAAVGSAVFTEVCWDGYGSR